MLASRRHNMNGNTPVTLVLTHGRDQPFQEPESEREAWAREVQLGLKRLDPPYTATVPMQFAFYGDIWRPDAGDVRSEADFGTDERDAVMTALAADMLRALGEPPPLALDAAFSWDTFASMIKV